MTTDTTGDAARVVIVGGGIGGLAAAVALKNIGTRVVVLERSEAQHEVGAGITLFTNGLAALDALGVGADLRALGDAVASGGIRRPRGSWLTRSPGAEATRRAGVELVTVHRADLPRRTLPDAPSRRTMLCVEPCAAGGLSWRRTWPSTRTCSTARWR